jgi:hypothetical protein
MVLFSTSIVHEVSQGYFSVSASHTSVSVISSKSVSVFFVVLCNIHIRFSSRFSGIHSSALEQIIPFDACPLISRGSIVRFNEGKKHQGKATGTNIPASTLVAPQHI